MTIVQRSRVTATRRADGMKFLVFLALTTALFIAAARSARAQSGATEVILHAFMPAEQGSDPQAGVTLDSAGNLYGTTYSGGISGFGSAYKIDLSGREIVLYSFAGGSDGANPAGELTADREGGLYGTTYHGGASNLGTLYKIDSFGNETVMHSFSGGSDGANPASGVVRFPNGDLYGTTVNGGASGLGIVYKIDAEGRETILHTFTGPDGASPYAGLITDGAGNLYGTTESGGTSNDGTLFKIDSAGQETVLFNFAAIGANPYAGVVRDEAGNFYGTTYLFSGGLVYKISPSGEGTVLFSFDLANYGGFPYSGVILDAAGNIYGTTFYGGDQAAGNLYNGYGVVFKLDPAGQETILHTFTSGTDGAYPYAGLVEDSQGNLYGTTTKGGAGRGGTVFKIPAQ